MLASKTTFLFPHRISLQFISINSSSFFSLMARRPLNLITISGSTLISRASGLLARLMDESMVFSLVSKHKVRRKPEFSLFFPSFPHHNSPPNIQFYHIIRGVAGKNLPIKLVLEFIHKEFSVGNQNQRAERVVDEGAEVGSAGIGGMSLGEWAKCPLRN
jgi:hypothetical protein